MCSIDSRDFPTNASSTDFKSYAPNDHEVKPPPAKRKRSKPPTRAIVTVAKDLRLEDHFYVHPMSVWGKLNIKSVKLSPPKYINPTTKVPVRFQLSGGGAIPFETKVDQWGGTNVSFSIDDETEAANLLAFNEALIQLAIKNRKNWWPKLAEAKKPVTEQHIRDNFIPLTFEPKEKTDGSGTWNPTMRTKVPISLHTGEPLSERSSSRQKICQVLDHDDAIISIHDIHHRTWTKVIVDCYGIFFTGKYGWGITKYVSKIKLAHDEDAEAEYQEVEFVETEEPAPKKRKKSLKDRGLDIDSQLSQAY
jgi:hypothetical protein